MKKIFVINMLLVFLVVNTVAQSIFQVEKIGQTNEIKFIIAEILGLGPSGIIVDEVDNTIIIPEGVSNRSVKLSFKSGMLLKSEEVDFRSSSTIVFYQCGKYLIGASDIDFIIRDKDKRILYIGPKFDMQNVFDSGISFILREKNLHTVFFVNGLGEPAAADTSGKLYSSREVLSFLKAYDPEKFLQSQSRAKELEFEEKFLAGKVFIWGKTYYSTPEILNKFYTGQYAIVHTQYDLQGNLYQSLFPNSSGNIRIVDPNASFLAQINVTQYSKIFSTYGQGRLFTHSTYVGFGGNIYFYVAGDEYTEMFRIRRTWGEPDYYAMAINGYTDDSYGEYVKTTLAKLSKEELRLLRNHLFALYGYVFKSEDLSLYFDKIVWYQAVSTATMDNIQLPSERQALFDLIVAEEEKR